LDILANNDWKRSIYFSSPYGSSVSIGLYQAGFVKQNGLVFELSPVRAKDNMPINMDRMYKNLMDVYAYGDMNKKGVLTDYYTRRHTSQYRSNFTKLAETYIRNAEAEKNKKENFINQIPRLRESGNKKVADSLQVVVQQADQIVADYNKRAIALIKKSLEVMPIERVIDYGEPNQDGRQLQVGNGITYPSYSDGSLHDYVGILYRAGDKAGAEKLGLQVAQEIETIFNYFTNSSAVTAYRNKEDLIAALSNYMTISMIASDEEIGNPNGVLSQRTRKKITELYQVIFESKYKELKDLSVAKGESPRSGYDAMMNDLKGHIDAVGIQFGYIARQAAEQQTPNSSSTQLTPEQIRQMMEQQVE
jgi:hypothetical protein